MLEVNGHSVSGLNEGQLTDLILKPDEPREIRQHKLGYLIDFAARLATLQHAKARREHSSGIDLVLV
jgi:hypothetical protein